MSARHSLKVKRECSAGDAATFGRDLAYRDAAFCAAMMTAITSGQEKATVGVKGADPTDLGVPRRVFVSVLPRTKCALSDL